LHVGVTPSPATAAGVAADIHPSPAIELSAAGMALSICLQGHPDRRNHDMARYAVETKTVNEAVSGGGLLVVAQWEPGTARPIASPRS
jgi:hypothetical protein